MSRNELLRLLVTDGRPNKIHVRREVSERGRYVQFVENASVLPNGGGFDIGLINDVRKGQMVTID